MIKPRQMDKKKGMCCIMALLLFLVICTSCLTAQATETAISAVDMVRATKTDSSGLFVLEEMREGTAILSISAGTKEMVIQTEISENSEMTVDLYQGNVDVVPKEQDLNQEEQVSGTVCYRGIPLEGVSIKLYQETRSAPKTVSGVTDAVRQATYNVNSSSIYGYATPNYPSADDPSKNGLTIWNFFKAKGLNSYAIAGILGNLYQESNLDPGKYQNGGPGRGLAQWEYGSDRYSNLLAFAAKRGTSWQNINTQLEFIWHELNGGDPATKSILDSRYGGISGFKNAKSVTWAVEAFEKSFERAGIPNYTARYKYANQFYNKYS